MQHRHFNRELYFNEQSLITEKYVIPYIKSIFTINQDTVIAEIGCAEAGTLRTFLDMGCKVTGIDISKIRIENATKFYAGHPLNKNLTLIAEDIFSIVPDKLEKFDLIILRDSLEHIQDQDKLLLHAKNILNQNGMIFLSFPPWRMPFGGHQQMCTKKLLSIIPYFHLLPKPLYVGILKLFGEKQYRIKELMAIRETRISIQKFRKIVSKNDFKIDKEDFFFINPGYEIKFGLKLRKLPKIFNIPYLRDFFTTVCFYIIRPN